MRQHWESPRIVSVDSSCKGLGDCFDGSSATREMCATGDSTQNPVTEWAHGCSSGGYAATQYGGCVDGTTVGSNT
jgi:hypothetical protein